MGGTSGSKQRQRKHVKRLGWRVRGVLFACVYCLSHHLVFPLRPCLASHPGSSFLDYRLYNTSHLCYTYALQIPQHFHLPKGVFIATLLEGQEQLDSGEGGDLLASLQYQVVEPQLESESSPSTCSHIHSAHHS